MAVTPQFPGYRLTPGVFDQRTVLRGREVIDERVVINPDDWLRSTSWAANWAVKFDGATSYASRNAAGLPSASLSVSAWVKIDSALATGTNYPFFSNNIGAGAFITFGKGGSTDNLVVRGGFSASGATNLFRASPAGHNTGQWYHFFATFDGTTFEAMIDGVSIGTANRAGQTIVTPDELRIGRGTTYAPVTMDEMSIWDRKVDVTAVRTAGGQPVDLAPVNSSGEVEFPTGLFRYWRMGDGYQWNTYQFVDLVAQSALNWTNGVQTTQIVMR